MSDEQNLRVNYDVFIRCVDCGVVFVPTAVIASKDIIENSRGVRCRILVVTSPNECPNCRNLRVVAD